MPTETHRSFAYFSTWGCQDSYSSISERTHDITSSFWIRRRVRRKKHTRVSCVESMAHMHAKGYPQKLVLQWIVQVPGKVTCHAKSKSSLPAPCLDPLEEELQWALQEERRDHWVPPRASASSFKCLRLSLDVLLPVGGYSEVAPSGLISSSTKV